MTVVYDADNEWTTQEWYGTGMSPMQIDQTYDADGQKATDTDVRQPDGEFDL